MGKTRLPIPDGAHTLWSAGCDELVPRDSRVIWAWFPRYSKAMLMVCCDYLYPIATLRTFLHTLQCRNAGLPEHLHSGIPALPIHGIGLSSITKGGRTVTFPDLGLLFRI